MLAKYPGITAAVVLALALGLWANTAAFARAASNVQTFALSDTKELVLLSVKADAVEYQGRKAVRLTKDTEKDGFALLRARIFRTALSRPTWH